MRRQQALKVLRNSLHLSHNQMFTYLTCSLKYAFQYVEARPMERCGVALAFGTAIHTALERYYMVRMTENRVEDLPVLKELFAESLELGVGASAAPIIYNKTTPDLNAARQLGFAMLEAFHTSVDLTGFEVVGVEMPLSAPLVSDTGAPTDFMLVGILDLLLKDNAGSLVVVDNKTAARAKSQVDVDEDLQLTAYSYLLAENDFIRPAQDVSCRIDALRKLKTPKLEIYNTVRSVWHRKRFVRVANAVLSGIDNRVFVPTKSWMCADCGYLAACAKW